MIAGAIIMNLCMVVGLHAVSYPVSQNLSSNTWLVQNANASIKVKAAVPGGIYSDLRTAGILSEDIFYRFNDEKYRWVAKDNWTFSTSFDVDSKVMQRENIFLEFEGLDTVASVLLNSHLLGKTDNMFILYQFDVKHLLQESKNSLQVQFTSPILSALQASIKTSYKVPPACVPSEYNGECHVNYLRKMQASFGWDWGPAFPSIGIWKEVTLRAYNTAYVRNIGVETRPDITDWKVSVTVYLDVKTTALGTLTATLVLDSGDKIISNRSVTISPQQNSPSLVFSVPKDGVKLWWPNGYGSQPLYWLTVVFQSGQEATKKTIRIGFRTISLVQMEAVPNKTDNGLTFYFRVNGEPIFAKGSNYIPLHILPELSANPTQLHRLLTSTRDANMNMLRVWGGGLYESDLFYEMSDELGILIWQDMMFACSMYPATEDFLASVTIEVSQQIQRLQHHACIAVWAGNNENEAALAGNWYGTQDNFTVFKADYVKLYVDTIKPLIKQLDKTRSYVTSSPSNGLESENEGYVAKNPYDSKYGDVHWYQYTLNLWNSVIFPNTRFASEYGVMSLPSIESFANITIPTDLSLTSDFMSKRQHHLAGYVQMTLQMKYNLYLPADADLETFIYLSQINQAMSIKTETESYRQGRSKLDSIGNGLTMGALYWQLNDVWQAPSWSSIEFNGKWKMLHFFAVDFFSPILVSPSVDVNKKLHVYVISDLKLHTSSYLIMELRVYNWQSLSPVFLQHYQFTMIGAGVVEVGSWDIHTFLHSIDGCKSGGYPDKNCFFYFSLLTSNATTKVGPDNFYFPSPLFSAHGPAKANIQIVSIKPLKTNHEFIITVGTDAIALFVWLDAVGVPGHFSHNGFLMVTDRTQVTFTSDQPITLALFERSLRIRSLQLNRISV